MEKTTYHTAGRESILHHLADRPSCQLTVEELTAALEAEGVAVGKSTVYRHVSKLLESGSVRRFETPGVKSFVYQYADVTDLCDDHYHLKCVKCGRLIHLECAKMDEVKKHILSDHDFIIGFDRAVLYGQCASCAAKG